MHISLSISYILPAVSTAFGRAYHLYSLYSLWESAIGNMLALQTFRHGTNPLNYISIQRTGLDPAVGAVKAGEISFLRQIGSPLAETYCSDCVGHVSVLRDSCKQFKGTSIFFLFKRCIPRFFAMQSGAGMLGFYGVPNLFNLLPWTVGGLIGFFTPTLKFHFDSKYLDQFKEDFSMPNVAYCTDKKIEASHLGISGSLKNGLNRELIRRIKEEPFKVLEGIVQFIFALGITLSMATPTLISFTVLPYFPSVVTVKTIALWASIQLVYFSGS